MQWTWWREMFLTVFLHIAVLLILVFVAWLAYEYLGSLH
jgi:hypothetical protein